MSRRPDIDGRSLLIDAARHLFAKEGVDAVSIRAVNREAGLGPAGVHYHFGSKEALVDEVLRVYGDELVRSILVEAEALAAAADEPTARQIVMLIAKPYLELLEKGGKAAMEWMRIVDQFLTSDPDRVNNPRANALISEAVLRAYPEIQEEIRERALRMSVRLLVGFLAQASAGLSSKHLQENLRAHEEFALLVDFLAGGLAGVMGRSVMENETNKSLDSNM
ncbi:TetR/AcrR family transcriptional regulator [Arthrobacter sp. BHU FT2]|nr:TetR/AcrR family transcriptional regulator [Arthrobacter sp. BHU FT2]